MRKLVTTAVAMIAVISSLAFSSAPVSAQMHTMGHPRCGRGMHWVPAHRDRRGHWVRAHCAPR